MRGAHSLSRDRGRCNLWPVKGRDRTGRSLRLLQNHKPRMALALEANAYHSASPEHKALRSIIIRHEQVLLAQSQQSAACNASHPVECRMCRWLMRMRDLAVSDDLTLTQEFLAQMIGVRRSSVSIIAGTLQKAGFIRYRRGNIRILDVEGLHGGSCKCYATVKSHYERLVSG